MLLMLLLLLLLLLLLFVCCCLENGAQCSKSMVMTAIKAMPKTSASSCLTDSLRSSSFKRSGNTVTNEMCRKPPAVKGMIQDVRASIKSQTLTKLKLKSLAAYPWPRWRPNRQLPPGRPRDQHQLSVAVHAPHPIDWSRNATIWQSRRPRVEFHALQI